VAYHRITNKEYLR